MKQFVTCWIIVLVAMAAAPEASAKASDSKDNKTQTEMFAPEDSVQLAEARIVSDAELGVMRAGFIDPTGMIYRFAVDVESQIDGALTFVRSLVLQPDGANGQMAATTSSQLVAGALPEGTTAQVVNGGEGVLMTSQDGRYTALFNRGSSGNIANVIFNTADNRNISQTVNIDIALQNVSAVMGQLSALGNVNAAANMYQSSRMHTLGFGM